MATKNSYQISPEARKALASYMKREANKSRDAREVGPDEAVSELIVYAVSRIDTLDRNAEKTRAKNAPERARKAAERAAKAKARAEERARKAAEKAAEAQAKAEAAVKAAEERAAKAAAEAEAAAKAAAGA